MITYGGLDTVWLTVMFDLPVDTKAAVRRANKFRKMLIKDGFIRMQLSVYIRHSPSSENADVHERRVKRNLPADGEVRIIRFTDKQFGRMKVFRGRRRKPTESAPKQVEMF